MKPPDHPVPSGDRTIARALIAALTAARFHVEVVTQFQSRDGKGVEAVQDKLMGEASAETSRLIAKGRQAGWQAWLTYHNYYKAPDLIGPAVARALGIPYIQVESTRAQKRLTGPWARFARAAEDATDAANVVFYFTQRDAQTLRRDAPAGQSLLHLRPFLTRDTLPAQSDGTGPILSVGMMRAGDKQASYHLIAQTLALMPPQGWQLEIAGDGPIRQDVEDMMRPFQDRVRFLGKLDSAALEKVYAGASMMFWPGVNEALGLIYLEAQAAGLPVIAQRRPGMEELLAPALYPDIQDGAAGLCKMLMAYLGDPASRRSQGQAAQSFVATGHLLPHASRTLGQGLAQIGVTP